MSNGWYFYADNSSLFSGPPQEFRCKTYSNTGRLASGSTIKVILDMNKRTIGFAINGKDYGVAFEKIPVDKELCSCVMLYKANDCVEIMK